MAVRSSAYMSATSAAPSPGFGSGRKSAIRKPANQIATITGSTQTQIRRPLARTAQPPSRRFCCIRRYPVELPPGQAVPVEPDAVHRELQQVRRAAFGVQGAAEFVGGIDDLAKRPAVGIPLDDLQFALDEVGLDTVTQVPAGARHHPTVDAERSGPGCAAVMPGSSCEAPQVCDPGCGTRARAYRFNLTIAHAWQSTTTRRTPRMANAHAAETPSPLERVSVRWM